MRVWICIVSCNFMEMSSIKNVRRSPLEELLTVKWTITKKTDQIFPLFLKETHSKRNRRLMENDKL